MTKTRFFLKRLGFCLAFLTIAFAEAQSTTSPKPSSTNKFTRKITSYGKKALQTVKKIPNTMKGIAQKTKKKSSSPVSTPTTTLPHEQTKRPEILSEQTTVRTAVTKITPHPLPGPRERSASFTESSTTHPQKYLDEKKDLKLPEAPTETPRHADPATDLDARLNRLTDGERKHKVASTEDIEKRLAKLKEPSSPESQRPKDLDALDPKSQSHQSISPNLERQLESLPEVHDPF